MCQTICRRAERPGGRACIIVMWRLGHLQKFSTTINNGDIYGRTRMVEMKLIGMCHDKVISVKCPDQTLTAGYLCEDKVIYSILYTCIPDHLFTDMYCELM